MNNNKLSSSVVVYNKIQDAVKTAQSIFENADLDNTDIFIIDNNSNEKIAHKIQELYPTFKYEFLSENIGFGKAHNSIIEKLDSKYHLVINPDILINENTIDKLVEFMDKHSDAVIACPKVLNEDGTLQYIAKNRPSFLALVARRVPFKFLKRIEDNYLMKDKDQENVLEVDFCTGCFFIIRTDVFKKIGGFDKDYFLYFEDADITMKAKEYGKAYYVPSSSVVHFWHRETASSLKQFLVQLKSMFIYFKKWGFKL